MTIKVSPARISKKMLLILGALILLAAVIFAPFRLTIAEKREFRVVDSKGAPVREAIVKQIWNQYSLDFEKEEIKKTDSKGYVFLPERIVKARVVDLVSGAIKNILEYTIHAGIGSFDSIIVHAEGYEIISFLNGKGLESGIVVLKKE